MSKTKKNQTEPRGNNNNQKNVVKWISKIRLKEMEFDGWMVGIFFFKNTSKKKKKKRTTGSYRRMVKYIFFLNSVKTAVKI